MCSRWTLLLAQLVLAIKTHNHTCQVCQYSNIILWLWRTGILKLQDQKIVEACRNRWQNNSITLAILLSTLLSRTEAIYQQNFVNPVSMLQQKSIPHLNIMLMEEQPFVQHEGKCISKTQQKVTDNYNNWLSHYSWGWAIKNKLTTDRYWDHKDHLTHVRVVYNLCVSQCIHPLEK